MQEPIAGRELSVGQLEIISAHHGFILEIVNHKPLESTTVFSVPTPGFSGPYIYIAFPH
jgi:hypothetical protein